MAGNLKERGCSRVTDDQLATDTDMVTFFREIEKARLDKRLNQ